MTVGQKIKTQNPAHPPFFSTVVDYKVKTQSFSSPLHLKIKRQIHLEEKKDEV